jgi:hypothetical protein
MVQGSPRRLNVRESHGQKKGILFRVIESRKKKKMKMKRQKGTG